MSHPMPQIWRGPHSAGLLDRSARGGSASRNGKDVAGHEEIVPRDVDRSVSHSQSIGYANGAEVANRLPPGPEDGRSDPHDHPIDDVRAEHGCDHPAPTFHEQRADAHAAENAQPRRKIDPTGPFVDLADGHPPGEECVPALVRGQAGSEDDGRGIPLQDPCAGRDPEPRIQDDTEG